MKTEISFLIKQHWLILTGALIMAVISSFFIYAFPIQKVSTDEVKYTVFAHRDESYLAKLSRLIPGNMAFTWQPPFAYSVYGLLADSNHSEDYRLWQQLKTDLRENWPEVQTLIHGRNWTKDFATFYRRVALLNTFLLTATCINIYCICLSLKLGKASAVIASFMLFLNPKMLFYISGLWPELLHLTLLTSAFLLLMSFFHCRIRKRSILLVLAGILFGYCALTKGLVGFYLLCLCPVLMYFSYIHARKNIKSSLTIIAIFYGCYFSVITVQKSVNYIKHQEFAISTNTWIALEFSLTPYREAGGSRFDRYWLSSNDPRTREELSKKRTIEYLRQANLLRIVGRQLHQFVTQQLNNSNLSIWFQRERWLGIDSANAVGSILIYISVFFTWICLLCGLTGVTFQHFKSFGSAILVTYIVYYLFCLLIVGLSPRYFIQVMPFLGIFATFPLWNRSGKTQS